MNLDQMFKHQCKIAPFYRFDACAVKTCKNHSEILESRCMLVERKESLNSDKGMSDHEIKYFKAYPDVKQVTKNKKRAFDAVYGLLIFDKYIEYCNAQPTRNFNEKLYNNKKLKRVMNNYPFNLKEFSFNLSTLSYVFRKATYDSFSIKTGCKMCADFDLTDMLGLSATTLTKLTELFDSMEIQNGSN